MKAALLLVIYFGMYQKNMQMLKVENKEVLDANITGIGGL